jgi:hypothetical protein
VRSATEGIVAHVGENDLGGKVVFILGAGGRTYYYAHLDRHEEALNAGDLVTSDTVIGYIGNTGNARTTAPHLHFAIFGTDGAINPLPLLRDRKVGGEGPRRDVVATGALSHPAIARTFGGLSISRPQLACTVEIAYGRPVSWCVC